jgi:hypothetical protein
MAVSAAGRALDFPQDRDIGRCPRELVEIRRKDPKHLLVLECLKTAGNDHAQKRTQTDGFFVVIPNHRAERRADFHLHREFLAQFADEGGFRRLPGIHLAAGKFPQSAEVLAQGALAGEECPLGILDDSTNNFDHGEDRWTEIQPSGNKKNRRRNSGGFRELI